MSADFRAYVDLRPFDVSPTDIYLDSIAVARTVLPGFDLRPGTIEDALFQAFAYMSALNIGSINRLPDSLMLGIGKMLQTPYNDGTRATMNVTFTANSNSGATIPAGTIVGWRFPVVQGEEGGETYFFETNEELVIAGNTLGDPLPTGTTACTSQVVGVIPSIASGQILNVYSYSQVIYGAQSAGTFVQGTDSEGIDAYLSRLVTNLASLSSAITTANQLQNYVLTNYPTLIKRCRVYDLTDPQGTLEIGDPDSQGKVTIFTYGPGRFLTSPEKAQIQTDVAAKSVAGLEIGVVDAVLLNFKVTATISYSSNIDASALEETIKDNLVTAFSYLYSPQSTDERLRYNDVLRNIYSTLGVQHVESLTISSQDNSGATITGVSISGGSAVYTCANTYSVGDMVTVTGITGGTLNFTTPRAITARTSTTFTVSSTGLSGTRISGGTSTAYSPNWGATSGNDILFDKKGSLLNIQREKITLTLNSVSI